MSERDLTHADLLRIIEIVETSSHFAEFHLKVGDIELDLRKKGLVAQTKSQERPQANARTTADYPPGVALVKSAMVGTFHRAAAPGAKPFVEIGSAVTSETTVGIIEVIGRMNSIPAGVNGVVADVLVADAAPVEFGQVLFVIEREG